MSNTKWYLYNFDSINICCVTNLPLYYLYQHIYIILYGVEFWILLFDSMHLSFLKNSSSFCCLSYHTYLLFF